MKNTSKLALSAMCAMAGFMTSCNLNSSDEGKKAVDTYTEMPPCDGDLGTSGSDIEGAKLYVKDEEALYACTDAGWVIENVSTFDMLPLCTDKGRKPTLGLEIFVQKDSASYRCLKTGWRLVDEEEDGTEEPTPMLENELLEGSISAIGPFVKNTSVSLADIYRDAKNDSVIVSDSVFKGEVVLKLGKFEVPHVVSYSDYMVLKVKGLFMDPLTGKASSNALELEALVNINEDDITVGITDFIVYKRVMNLIKSGYQIVDAITRAKKELYDVFGFANVDNRQSADLAIGLLLRSNLEEADFVDLVQSFADDFAEDGLYSSEDKMTELGDFAFNIENMKLKDEESGEVILKESDYRKNLEAFGITESAAFEEYFTKFWVASYGLGGCASSRQHVVVKNANENSDSTEAYFTCDNAAWRVADDLERDTVFLGNAADGTLMKGNIDSEKTYVFDTTGMGTGTPKRWVEPDSIVLVIGSACTDDEKVKFTVKQTKDENDIDRYYACVDRNWVPAFETAFRIGRECSKADKNVVEKYENSDKKNEYARCHETKTPLEDGDTLFSYSWISTDEVNYKFREKECALNDVFKDGDKYYVCENDEDIHFREVTDDAEKELGICSESVKGSFGTYKVDKESVYRVCQEKPYVPGEWEWAETDKISYESKIVCSAENIGKTATSDEVNYTCGCRILDMDEGTPVEKLVTDADECGVNTIEWQKN